MNAVKRLLTVACAVAVLGVWLVTLRPASLGGPAGYVMIRGTSMLPTYVGGDLIITRKADSYAKGDIVAYRVPDGGFGEGMVIIHRIIGGSAKNGFVIQGDNNDFRDDWYPKPADMVGKAWLRIPRLGLLLAFLRAPVPLGALAAAIAVVLVLFPEKKTAPVVAPETAELPGI